MLQPSLVISALFGIAQVATGIALVRRLMQGWQWTNRGILVGALAGLWLVTSGVGECIVAVVSQTPFGHASTIAPLRGMVDVTLLIVTIILLVALFLYPIMLTAHTKRHAKLPADQ